MVVQCFKCNKKVYCKGLCRNCYYKKRQDESPRKKCECSPECPEIIPSINIDGEPMKYKKWHCPKGRDHPHFKGKPYVDSDGYMRVYCPDHPKCYENGYVLRHRLVYEQYYNICLLPWIEIHHIIPIKEGGTDDIWNLLPITTSDHLSIHKAVDKSGRKCSNPRCKDPENTYVDKYGHVKWCRDGKGGWLCKNCKESIRGKTKRLKKKLIQ